MRHRLAAGALLLLAGLFLVGHVTGRAEAPTLKIYFFDVGQGDGVLIQSATGQNVVYDGGESSERMLDYLLAHGVERVDLVVASHNHLDHIGGLPSVVRHFRPRFYLENGIPAATLLYNRLLHEVEAAGTQILEATDRRISLGEVSLQVLPPPRFSEDQNNNSVGVIVAFETFRLSLGGDAEGPEWAWWVSKFGTLLTHVQVHKASHHGSGNGDSAPALARLSPEHVVVGCGRSNMYGHPTQEALALYQRFGAQVHRTDRDGSILISVDASGKYTVQSDPIPAGKNVQVRHPQLNAVSQFAAWRSLFDLRLQ